MYFNVSSIKYQSLVFKYLNCNYRISGKKILVQKLSSILYLDTENQYY